jgi:hypothetical protein
MKSKRLIKKVPAELDVLHFPAPDERPFGALCSNCSVNLSLSQPDLYSPDRLIGVCERCKYWFLTRRSRNQKVVHYRHDALDHKIPLIWAYF